MCQSLSASPLTALVSGSDAIVAGSEFAETQAGNTITFNLNVERVFSGNVQSGATLNVVWNAKGFVSLPDKSPGYRGIWFLKSGTNGVWECISAGASGNAEFFPDLSLPIWPELFLRNWPTTPRARRQRIKSFLKPQLALLVRTPECSLTSYRG
jgi:hypothetical protein